MMKGKFEVRIDEKADNMLDALFIKQERCVELCNIIDQIENEHPGWNLGQVLNEASKHCENENERNFMLYVFGTHVGAQRGFEMGSIVSNMERTFSQFFKDQERDAHSFARN